MADEEHEVVVTFEHFGDSVVLAETEDDYIPGAHPGEVRVEVDPLVEAFARSPYDPIIGAMMMGRATGAVIANPPRIPWMRAIAYALAIGLIGQFLVSIYFWMDADAALTWLSAPGTILNFLLAVGGLILLARLSRGTASNSSTGRQVEPDA